MTFEKAIDHVLSSEGGFTLNKKDKGNWTGGEVGKGILKGTNWGISAASYPNLDIKGLTRSAAIRIYYADFWMRYKIFNFPDRIQMHMLDVCINSGFSRAVKILQRAAGITVDGDAGPQTMKASVNVDVWEYARERTDFYIVYADLNYEERGGFLKGWVGRVLKVTEFSLAA